MKKIYRSSFPFMVSAVLLLSLFFFLVIKDRHVIADLSDIDERLLIWLNADHSIFSPELMMNITDHKLWIPFYCSLILYLICWDRVRFGRFSFFIGLYLILQLSILYFLTVEFYHLRPLYQQEIAGMLKLETRGREETLGYLPMSSNAAGIALFICLYLKRNLWPLKIIVIVWALLLLYASLYNGWNYPHEILISVIISMMVAYIAYRWHLYYSRKGRLI